MRLPNRTQRPAVLLGLALALIVVVAPHTRAAVVYFADQDIPIPTDFAGVSVDLETGAVSNSLDGLADGDANFFFGGAELSNDADEGAASPSWQPVRTANGNTDPADALTFGATVDGSSTYASGFGSSGDVTTHFPPFTAGQQGYLGFSMIPNGGGAEVFGWMLVTLQTEASGLEGTIHSWAYESQPGVAITVGAIPEPGAAILALLGATGLAFRRRR